MKDKFRRLKVRIRDGFEDLRANSLGLASSEAENRAHSERSTANSQLVVSGNTEHEDKTEATASASITTDTVDVSSWADIWEEAYKTVKTDPEQARLVERFEKFLEKGEGTTEVELLVDDNGESAAMADSSSRLKTIQSIAERKLESFSDAQLSFNIGKRPVIVRSSIIKAVQVINTLKPIISGVVAAEPSAALAWAGVTTVLPILESIFQQDDLSGASRELLSRVKVQLVDLYTKIYIYEARFILQYASRNKAHRAFRNAWNADGWKTLWSEIEATSRRIDQGIRGQIDVQTLKTWMVVKDIQESTERIEALQHDTLKAVQEFDRRQLLQSLKVTGNAIFDSRQTSSVKAPCLPGTQCHILQTIQDWTEDPQVAEALEARTPFADLLKSPSKAFLGATFFFAQGDVTRSNTVELFPTIAWCLADVFLDFGLHVTKAIKDNPGIQTKVPLQQLQKLVLGPLTLLDEATFMPLQLVVVLDALDECEDRDAEDLLAMLVSLENLRQIQLRLLITSRREEHISTSFKHLPSRLYRRVKLKKVEASPGENNDITFYLSKTLSEIAKTRGVEDGGVSKTDIDKLAEKSDGLFIYAATACRFLNSSLFVNKKLRDIRLSLIFKDEIESEGPQEKVDGIYLKVLTFPEIQKSHERVRALFYYDISRLIGFIVVLFRPASVETLCHLLPTTRTDLDQLLGHLHSIINVPEGPGFPISLVHLSFRDFVLNEKRSERLPFSVNELVMHREVFDRCFELMNSELRQDICRLVLPGSLVSDIEPSHIADHIPQYLQYACRYWVSHLSKIDGECLAQAGLEDDGLVHIFLREKLLYWLEVMAFIGDAPSIIPVINQLESLIEVSLLKEIVQVRSSRLTTFNHSRLKNQICHLWCMMRNVLY
ncbi:hypothetical protein IL306_015189 [Fusarium sp. DS 682]|nr:hypothetical protein IL306_015189 [Fusarium sp. DS 682]